MYKLKIFDTICKATDERQSEARLLAGASDQMIVIGDKKSSNTKRLYEISRTLCKNVLYIEDAAELTDAGALPGWARRDHSRGIDTGMDN